MNKITQLLISVALNYFVLLLFITLSIYSITIHDILLFIINVIGGSMIIIKFFIIKHQVRTLEN